MISRTVFICETCKKESDDKEEIRECEAGHLGLTVEEADEYKSLQLDLKYQGYVVSRTNNQQTKNIEDMLIKQLIEFEKAHGISPQN